MTADSTGSVVPLTGRHAAETARLHAVGIDDGFLSTLGQAFLKQIYRAVPACASSFGYAFETDGRVLGFIACAESTATFYKQALKRRMMPMLWSLKRHVLHPIKVKQMWQTLRYPADVGADLPAAEVLSIAVDEDARGLGVGKALAAAAIEELRRRGIDRLKVAVGADAPAVTFYERLGFTLAVQRTHHGLPMNVYVLEIPPRADLGG